MNLDLRFAVTDPGLDRPRRIMAQVQSTTRSTLMQPHPDDHLPTAAVRDLAARGATAVGLLGVGLIHLLDSIGKYHETRYLFWMYIALILGTLATAGAVLFTRSRLAFLAAAGLAASALAGFVINRTVGLPNATGDIGNWTEPLGLASMVVEAATIAVAAGGLAMRAMRRAVVA